jgi:hypothetical protein
MGEQVAWNKCPHSIVELFENPAGEYYPVVQRMDTPALIRGEYIPIGSRLQYPTKWGRKKGATILLEHKIQDKQKQLKEAESELAKLSACLENVHLWENDSKE